MPNKYSNYPNGFANGVTIHGMPILNTHSGDVFWVDSNNGADTGKGDFNKPFATIDYAVGRCTDNKGDVILVKAGHAETVSTAAAIIDADKEGISIIGLGNGDDRPTITFSHADADIDIDADNVTIANMIFLANEDVAAAIDVNKEYFTLSNCTFISNAAAYSHLICVISDANANDMTIENCNIQLLVAEDGSTAVTQVSTEAIRLVGADRAKIIGNYISGDFTTAAINSITTASLDIQIDNNKIHNIATENITGGIDLYTGSTGGLDGNLLYVDDPTAATDIIDAASCFLGINKIANATGEAPATFGTPEVSDPTASVGVIASAILSEVGSVGTLTTDISTAASTVTSSATVLSTYSSVLGSAATAVSTSASTLASSADTVSTALSEVGSVGTQAGSVGTLVSTVDSYVSVIESEVASAGTAVGSVGTIASTIDSWVSVLNSKITSVGTVAAG